MAKGVGRRRALWLGAGGLVTVTAVAAGCGPAREAGPQPAGTAGAGATAVPGAPATPGKFKEAPQLAQLVKDGKLPPVEQRLPKEPLVLKPVERVGQYGGEWRLTTTGRADGAHFTRVVGYEGLVRWSPDWKTIEPNLATKWEANSAGTEFTFTLREGVKWSDGTPLSVDDFIFWLEDMAKNPELTPVFPAWLVTEGKTPNIVKVGEGVFKYQFAAPNGLFLQRLATPAGLEIFAPAHFLKPFHKKYAGEQADAAVKAEMAKNQQNFEEEAKRRTNLKGDWALVFNVVNDYPFTPARPTIYAWKLIKGVGDGTRVTWERNPYFWKVDPDGNQLPYIDNLTFEQHEKVDTMVLKALGGEIDAQARHIASLANKSVFVDNQQKGNYSLFESTGSSMNSAIIALNLAHKDPELRKIFQDKRFRQAMSHAINRKEAIDLIYVGQGEPAQPAPLKESPFYNEQLKTQFLEYSPQKANALLDEMGLTKKDGSGMRLRLDGQPLFIAFEVNATSQEWVDYLQLVKKYWAAVGVNMEVKAEDRAIFYTRKENNDHDAGMWGGDGGLEVILEPRWYFPFSLESVFATSWARWFETGGKQGDEPIEPAKQQMDLYRQLLGTADEKKQSDLMKQILQLAADQFWAIGLSVPVKGYGIVRNDFHNLPKQQLGAWLYPDPGPLNPAQFFTTRK
jgi:ABC-type transport system substrate-binding protein